MRDVALIILFDELLLFRRALLVEVDDNEVYLASVFLVQAYGAASLPLRIESALAEHEDVIRLAMDRALLNVIAGNQRAVLAVT